jgi:hypothetical protein
MKPTHIINKLCFEYIYIVIVLHTQRVSSTKEIREKNMLLMPGIEPRRFNYIGSSPVELRGNFSEILSCDASALLIVQYPTF